MKAAIQNAQTPHDTRRQSRLLTTHPNGHKGQTGGIAAGMAFAQIGCYPPCRCKTPSKASLEGAIRHPQTTKLNGQAGYISDKSRNDRPHAHKLSRPARFPKQVSKIVGQVPVYRTGSTPQDKILESDLPQANTHTGSLDYLISFRAWPAAFVPFIIYCLIS